MRPWIVWLRGLTLFVAGIVVGTLMMQRTAAQENSNAGLRLNHVGIAVSDFQESLNFYTKVMGFRVAYAMPSPDGKPTTTFLQINRDTFIEMAPASANLPAGLTHIGLLADNADAAIARLREAGATAARRSFRRRNRVETLKPQRSQWNSIGDCRAAFRLDDEKSDRILEVSFSGADPANPHP